MSHDRRERLRPTASPRYAAKRALTRRTPLSRGDVSSPTTEAPELPHVVIVGGGFGGLYAAKSLRKAPVRITLLDRRNHHLFQPLLYQVATAGLNPAEIATPIRRILRKQENVRVLLAEALAVDAPAKRLQTTSGDIDYDILIIATGAGQSYFGHNEWAKVAPGLKTLEDALEIRRRILTAFESAEACAKTEEDRNAWMTFVIVGGGPTGVELAGALTEIAHHSIVGDFRTIDPRNARVILVEGEDRVLMAYPPELSEKAKKQLEDLGVEVRLSARVTAVDEEGVKIGGERIASHTVLWAAGVAASPLARSLGTPLDRAGRVKVEQDLTVPGHPEIFVIGDLASIMTDGKPVPGVAPAAIQEARHTARNIRRTLAGGERQPFRYRDKGSLATIGRAAAVADLRHLKLSGFVAWVAWLLIHVFFLIGFRNRFLVLFDWAWSYLTYERGARLITGDPPPHQLPPHVPSAAQRS